MKFEQGESRIQAHKFTPTPTSSDRFRSISDLEFDSNEIPSFYDTKSSSLGITDHNSVIDASCLNIMRCLPS
jgi:hypothetical protein